MNVYVLTIKRGRCNVCAETYILGVFTEIALVNSYIREHTIYGMIAQFVHNFDDIELDDVDHGVVVLSVTKTVLLQGKARDPKEEARIAKLINES